MDGYCRLDRPLAVVILGVAGRALRARRSKKYGAFELSFSDKDRIFHQCLRASSHGEPEGIARSAATGTITARYYSSAALTGLSRI